MPGGDGNGPWWAQGGWSCRRGFGRFGFGRGFGRGYWNYGQLGYQQPITAGQAGSQQPVKTDEAEELKAYAASLKAELNNVEKRLKQLGVK